MPREKWMGWAHPQPLLKHSQAREGRRVSLDMYTHCYVFITYLPGRVLVAARELF